MAQFQNERLEAGNQPVLKLPFLHRPCDAEKSQIVAALQHLVRLLREMLRQRESEVVRLLLPRRPFIRLRFDLVQQHAPAPAALRRGAEVVEPGSGIGELVQNQPVMAPRNFGDKLSQKFVSRVRPQFGRSLWPNLL